MLDSDSFKISKTCSFLRMKHWEMFLTACVAKKLQRNIAFLLAFAIGYRDFDTNYY